MIRIDVKQVRNNMYIFEFKNSRWKSWLSTYKWWNIHSDTWSVQFLVFRLLYVWDRYSHVAGRPNFRSYSRERVLLRPLIPYSMSLITETRPDPGHGCLLLSKRNSTIGLLKAYVLKLRFSLLDKENKKNDWRESWYTRTSFGGIVVESVFANALLFNSYLSVTVILMIVLIIPYYPRGILYYYYRLELQMKPNHSV